MNGFKVTLQNISPSYPQKSWVSMGLPKNLATTLDFYNGLAKLPDGREFPASIRGQELFIEANLKAGEKVTVDCIPTDDTMDRSFEFSPWVTDEINKIIPQFVLKSATGETHLSLPITLWDGQGDKPQSYIYLEECNDIRYRFFFHTLIEAAPMVVEGWIDVFSNQDIVPITIRASYGNVTSEALLNKSFGSLSMFTGEKPVIDFCKTKGCKPPIFRTQDSLWESEIASPRVWWKARTIEAFGALLATTPYNKFSIPSDNSNFYERLTYLKAREEAPIMGIADVWQGNWLSFGKVPEVPKNAVSEISRLYSNLMRRINTYGDEYYPRDFAQPPNSGQTGEQPDFGASKCELAVSLKQPWALWDYRFSVQAWMLRPYSHKDKHGEQILASDHPDAKLYNLAVDSRFSDKDMLGFPNPIPYNEFWTGSDSQHRSDNLLLGLYALTRDPSIKATILGLIECQKMEVRPWRMFPPQGSIESPRGWGRPLIAMAHLVSLGFDEVGEYMMDMVETMYKNAALRGLPNDKLHTVRTLSRWGQKYGWTDGSGKPITAWVCWEEAIAVMGLWAAYKVSGSAHARELALDIARTIAKHGFFKASDSNWYSCYCVKFNEADYGIPLPDSSYNLDPNSKEVVVYGMHRWMLPALRLLVANITTSDPDFNRATNIINFFGSQPADFADSGWWAVI
jgi:hypothetical protein